MTFTATSPSGKTREFYDSNQFAIFRRAGWKSDTVNDAWADEKIKWLDGASEVVLAYFAPTISGTAERDELHRRRYPEVSKRLTE